MLPFPLDNPSRKYSCFICSQLFDKYDLMKQHIFDNHEEGREYLLCPLKHCSCPVRDLRQHFKCKHPHNKLPKDCQLRAIVMYDLRDPKRKKVPSFKEGYYKSLKNNMDMHYRSGYEKEVYECLDRLGDVQSYNVEPFSIPYYMRGKKRQYFPDLKVTYTDGSVEIWEIKPLKQVQLPQNTAKFNAAKQFCQLRGWNFEVITEQSIEELKRR